eukprot:jgi/Picre1/32316/NNA_007662.t1
MSAVIALSRAFIYQPKRVWTSYLQILEKKPVQTKISTSIAAAFLGDTIAQRLSKRKEDVKWRPDWGRTARLCAFNGAMGLFGHYYYAILDKTVVIGTAKSAVTVLAKVGIDQFIFAPVCTMLFYLFKVSTEGRPSEFIGEMQAKYVPTLVAGWKLWPAAHVVNFLFIPNQHRILYTNIISVAGTYILSMAASGDHTAQKRFKEEDKEI